MKLPQNIKNCLNVFSFSERNRLYAVFWHDYDLPLRFTIQNFLGVKLFDNDNKEIILRDSNLLQNNAIRMLEDFIVLELDSDIFEETQEVEALKQFANKNYFIEQSLDFLQLKEQKMITKTIETPYGNVTVEAETMQDYINLLQQLNLKEQLYSTFYYSKSEKKHTGNGWIEIKSMNKAFILNAIMARLGDNLKWLEDNVDNERYGAFLDSVITMSDTLAMNLYYFVNSVSPDSSHIVNNNANIIAGLVGELLQRNIEDTQQNQPDSAFDDEDDE